MNIGPTVLFRGAEAYLPPAQSQPHEWLAALTMPAPVMGMLTSLLVVVLVVLAVTLAVMLVQLRRRHAAVDADLERQHAAVAGDLERQHAAVAKELHVLHDQVASLQTRLAERQQGQVPGPCPDTFPPPLREIDEAVELLVIDRREKDAFEKQMIRGQKMEMLGVLTNCIAHDFKNLLGAITNALDLIGQEVGGDRRPAEIDWPTILSALQTLRSCANRGRDTVNQMLSFAKADLDDRRLIDLNMVLGATRQMCVYSIDKRIEVVLQQAKRPAPVTGNAAQLEQALLNLCLNAQDAMPDGGIIRIDLAFLNGESDTRVGPAWQLRVSDTGTGIDEATLGRIFSPFYTTKSHGTGLGLVIVKKIVESHGGRVSVASQLGEGTTFTILLPQGMGELPRQATSLADAPSPRKAREGEHILIVDDESAIRRINFVMLQRLGYQVIEATCGNQAVELYRERHAEISLVMLDLILPDINGDQVFEQLKQINEEVRVLLMSGLTNDKRIGDMIINGCQGFLSKPYTLTELSAAFEQILDR